MEDQYKISDPQVLKVVTHPLRVRLLDPEAKAG